MMMSHRVLAVLAVLSLAACPEHAPAWYGLTDEGSGTTGDPDGGGSFPPTSAAEGPDPGGSSGEPPTPTTGDWTTGAVPETTTSGESTAAPVNEPPTVALALSPEIIEAAGVVELSIEVSPDVVELDHAGRRFPVPLRGHIAGQVRRPLRAAPVPTRSLPDPDQGD